MINEITSLYACRFDEFHFEKKKKNQMKMPLQNDPNTYMFTDSRLVQHFCTNCTKIKVYSLGAFYKVRITICMCYNMYRSTAVGLSSLLHISLSTPLSTNSLAHKKHRSRQRKKVMQCTAGIDTEAGLLWFKPWGLASNII